MLPMPDVPLTSTPDALRTLRAGDWLALALPAGQRALLHAEASGVRLEALDGGRVSLPVSLADRAAVALSGFPVGSAFDVVLGGRGLFFCDYLRIGADWLGQVPTIDRFARIAPLAPIGGGVYLPDLTMGDVGEFLEEARADPDVVAVVVKRWDSPLVGGTNPGWFQININR